MVIISRHVHPDLLVMMYLMATLSFQALVVLLVLLVAESHIQLVRYHRGMLGVYETIGPSVGVR
jgi:hypothetical protein